MVTEWCSLRRNKCKKQTIFFYGFTMSACCIVYVLGLMTLSRESIGDPLLRLHNTRNLQTSFENDDSETQSDFNTISGNLNSNSVKTSNMERDIYTNVIEKDSNIFLEEEDEINTKINQIPKVKTSHSDNKNKTKRLPQALIIGVKKAGTRALLEYLRLHPDVRAPGPEPHFFDKNYNKGLNWYRNLMPETSKGQLTVEKTPSYFVTKGIPERVYKMSKHTKLIVVFRDPVTRAISDYAQWASRKPGVKSFEEMVYVDNKTKIINTSWTIVKIGIYAQHLARWLEYFPIRQFHFVSGENLIKDPGTEMKRLQEFLGLDEYITSENFTFNQTKGFPCYTRDKTNSRWHCLNEEKGRQHPGIHSSINRHLQDFYRPFNVKLYSMTGQDFGWS